MIVEVLCVRPWRDCQAGGREAASSCAWVKNYALPLGSSRASNPANGQVRSSTFRLAVSDARIGIRFELDGLRIFGPLTALSKYAWWLPRDHCDNAPTIVQVLDDRHVVGRIAGFRPRSCDRSKTAAPRTETVSPAQDRWNDQCLLPALWATPLMGDAAPTDARQRTGTIRQEAIRLLVSWLNWSPNGQRGVKSLARLQRWRWTKKAASNATAGLAEKLLSNGRTRRLTKLRRR